MGVNVKDIFPHLEGEEITLVQRAYDIAATSLEGRLRDSGAPFLEHPLGVARIVDAEIGLQPVCVAAVFLHEASRMNPEAKAMITGFPQEVMQIVDGLDKISTINPKDTRLEAENYKRLIVQYSTDPRVTVIKIADRLEVMRNLSSMPKSVRERKCLETLMLYIPLAHQLGLYNIKSEMEDIYFRHVYPEEYRTIGNKLKATERTGKSLPQNSLSRSSASSPTPASIISLRSVPRLPGLSSRRCRSRRCPSRACTTSLQSASLLTASL